MVGAKLMGRWASGAPLELNPDQDPGTAAVTNAFEYAAAPFGDDDGHVIPHFAHIRKANPRDETTPDPESDNPQRHRMIRQGIPFGDPLPDGTTAGDSVERGLHFIAFVADPVRQFEFVESNWMNNPNFPNGQKTGLGQPYGPAAAGHASGWT
jgi:deferrochelatase/peroxidase EfeB